MTNDVKLGIDNQKFVEGMKAAAKASDELYAAVSKLSSQGGTALDTFNKRGAAAVATVRSQFGPEIGDALGNLAGSVENSANLFTNSAAKIRKAHEASAAAMLADNKQFSLEYFNTWKNLGQSVPAVLKPIYVGLLADEKAATVAAKEQSAQRVANFKQEAAQRAATVVGLWKEDTAAAKMGGELRRLEEAKYQAWLKAAAAEQATREKLQAENRGTWAKISADFKISEERRYQAWLKAAAVEQSAREKLQAEKTKAEIQQRNDWAAAQESKFQQVVKTARAQVSAANKEREESYTSWWKTELAKRDSIQNEYARKLAANGDVMKDMFIANESAKIAAVKRTQLAAEASAVSQVRGAMLAPSGAFSQLSDKGLVFPKTQVTGFTGVLKDMHIQMRQNIVDGNDMHSAMRGLASGFNLLWLTWGNLAPLFTGAVISFGTRAVIEMGAQVQHTFETIQTLTGSTTESMKSLQAQMHTIAESGPVGPLAVADAMKTLALAGLDATQVSMTIKDVLNFAVAGDVDIKKAADVMTTVATAFGITANTYGLVGEAIAKTAAVSKSSVEDIGEAFKTSSVLNKQYGASLTDVGVGLAALANLGIRGSAAGTALRNMYADLSGRTSEVAATLKRHNLDLRDQFGNFKNIVAITSDISKVLDTLKGKAQKDFLQQVLSERGGKVVIELLDLAKRKAEETGDTIRSELEKMQAEIEDRAGFASIAAAKLNLTPLNQMRSVVATMQSELIKAFDAIAPTITTISLRLKEMFKSEEFQNGVQNLVIGFANIALWVGRNIDTLSKLALAFAALKVGQFAYSMGTVAVGALKAFEVAAASTTAATLASGAALTAFQTRLVSLGTWVGKWLVPLASFASRFIAIGSAVWFAYEAYKFFSDKKDDVLSQGTGSQHTAYLDALKEETDRINEQTLALRMNISVEELRQKKKLEGLKTDAAGDRAGRLAAANTAVQKALTDLSAYDANAGASQFREGAGRARLEQAVKAAQTARDAVAAQIRVEEATERLATFQRENAVKRAMKEQAWWQQVEDLKNKKAPGDKDFTTVEEEKRRAKEAKLKAATDKVEQAIDRQAYEAQRSEAKQAYDQQVHDLESLHRHKLVSEGWYEAQSLKEYNEYSKEMSKLNRETLTKAARGYIGARKFIEDSLTGEEKANALAKLRKDYEAFVDSVTKSDSELELTGLNKINEAVNKANGSVKDLAKSVNKFLDENANELAASATEVGEAFDKYTAAGMEAAAKQAEKYSNKIDEVNRALVEMSATITYLNENGGADQAAKFVDAQKQLQGLLDQLKARSKDAQATAYKNAVDKLKAADFRKLTESIADAIIKGGVNSGPQLRAILEEEFLSKPFKVLIEAAISDVTTGGLSKLLSGNGATGTKLAQIGSNLKGVYDFVTSPTGWFSHDGFAANIGEGSMDVGAKLSQLGAKFDSKWLNESGKWLVENADLVGKYADAAGSAMSYISAIQSADKGKWGAAIGQAVGTAYFGPLGGAVGGAIGGWVDDAFGGGHESSLGGGITGTFGANGQFSGQRFDRRRNSGQSGLLGIGGTSAREWDNLSSLETGVSTALSVQFFMLKAQTSAFAESLGLSTSSITAYTRAMRLSLGSDAAANQKAVADFFTTMANEMAAGLLDSKYFKEGETAADALARLSVNLTSVNSAFELMGKGKLSSTLDSALTADSLITMFGGKDKFDSAQASFYNAFYSDAEKQANLKKSLESSFASLGKTLPTTRDAFRQMVVAQDITTESGKQTYAQLLTLSEAFDSLTATAKKASEAVSETDFSTQVAYLRFKGRLGLGGSVAGLSKTPGFATGGVHSGGWRVVGESGSELEHTGPSRIYNHADSLFDDTNIVAELKALRTEVSYLRADARATAANTKKAANVYDKWDSDGMPEVRA